MLIGELSKRSGFSRDTIRYYEKIGLLELPRRSRRENNYKDYPDAMLKILLTIRNLKNLGFTLEEIREILIRREMDALDSNTTHQIIEQKIIHLDLQIDKLRQYRSRLEKAQLQALGEDKTNHLQPFIEMRRCA